MLEIPKWQMPWLVLSVLIRYKWFVEQATKLHKVTFQNQDNRLSRIAEA